MLDVSAWDSLFSKIQQGLTSLVVQTGRLLGRTLRLTTPLVQRTVPPVARVQLSQSLVLGLRANSTAAPGSVPQLSRWRRFLQTLGRVTLVTLLGTSGLFVYTSYKDRTPGPQEPFNPDKKTIVVLGSGWGATSLLKSIDNEDYNIVRSRCAHIRSLIPSLTVYHMKVVISPRNYFLFTPLLPSVAIGTLDARSIIQPTRYITRHKGRVVHVYEAEATDVDVQHFYLIIPSSSKLMTRRPYSLLTKLSPSRVSYH